MKRLLAVFAFLFLATALLGATCKPLPPTPVEPKDTESCPAACEKLRELGCPEGEPLEDGTTCEEFCKTTQESGHALRPSCIVGITECSQVRDCEKGSRDILE